MTGKVCVEGNELICLPVSLLNAALVSEEGFPRQEELRL